MWPDNRILDLFRIEVPILQAPMAGSTFADMAVAVSEAGGLGSLPCALLSVEQARTELESIRRRTSRSVSVNFFCHTPPQVNRERENRWKDRLQGYYTELGIDPDQPITAANRAPFDERIWDVVGEFHPEVVSFHFGLPNQGLLGRVKRTGAKIVSSATIVDEARWLEDHGCDAIIAQGYEAGGHRGMFLTKDVSSQPGTMALVPQVVDAVRVPVIASGGISDGRGIAAALALGAAAVQLGTAYLFCPEAKISPAYRQALQKVGDHETVITNVITGRPARGIATRLVRDLGPMSDDAPEFPLAASPLAPLRSKSESSGSGDFSPLWAGQAVRLAREMPAGQLTKRLAAETQERLRRLAG
jgi:nitronate monooxygenase